MRLPKTCKIERSENFYSLNSNRLDDIILRIAKIINRIAEVERRVLENLEIFFGCENLRTACNHWGKGPLLQKKINRTRKESRVSHPPLVRSMGSLLLRAGLIGSHPAVPRVELVPKYPVGTAGLCRGNGDLAG